MQPPHPMCVATTALILVCDSFVAQIRHFGYDETFATLVQTDGSSSFNALPVEHHVLLLELLDFHLDLDQCRGMLDSMDRMVDLKHSLVTVVSAGSLAAPYGDIISPKLASY